jgi:hypothetical protein
MSNLISFALLGAIMTSLTLKVTQSTFHTLRLFHPQRAAASPIRNAKNDLLTTRPPKRGISCTERHHTFGLAFCSQTTSLLEPLIDIAALSPQSCPRNTLIPNRTTAQGNNLSHASHRAATTCTGFAPLAILGNGSFPAVSSPIIPSIFFASGYWESQFLVVNSDTIIIAGGDILLGTIQILNPSAHLHLISFTGGIFVNTFLGVTSPSVRAPLKTLLPFLPSSVPSRITFLLPQFERLSLGYIISPHPEK